jgi:hypothetical protein
MARMIQKSAGVLWRKVASSPDMVGVNHVSK